MYATGALLASSAPVAGLYLWAEDRPEQRDLFLVCYVAAVGAIVSLIAALGGFASPADLVGATMVDAH